MGLRSRKASVSGSASPVKRNAVSPYVSLATMELALTSERVWSRNASRGARGQRRVSVTPSPRLTERRVSGALGLGVGVITWPTF